MKPITKEIVELTYALQLLLEQMPEEEFEKYIENKVIKLNGKLYGRIEKEVQ